MTILNIYRDTGQTLNKLSQILTNIATNPALNKERVVISRLTRFIKAAENYSKVLEKDRESYSRLGNGGRQLSHYVWRNMDYYITVAQSYLISEAATAIDSSKEYSYGPFRDRLLTALENRAVVKLTTSPINVTFDMDGVCGSLGDYFYAIEQVRPKSKRRTRGVAPKKPAVTPRAGEDMASIFWRDKIYAAYLGANTYVKRYDNSTLGPKYENIAERYSGSYERIIAERFAAMRTPAPFWELLDKGNINLTGYGQGVAYPEQAPTHFVSRAVIGATKQIKNLAMQAKSRDMDFYTDMAKRIVDYQLNLLRMLSNAEQLLLAIKNNATMLYRSRIAAKLEESGRKSLERAAKRAGATPTKEQYKAISIRAEEQAARLVSGEISGRIELGTYGGVGWSIRIRARTIRVEREASAGLEDRLKEEKFMEERMKYLQEEARKLNMQYLEIRQQLLRLGR